MRCLRDGDWRDVDAEPAQGMDIRLASNDDPLSSTVPNADCVLATSASSGVPSQDPDLTRHDIVRRRSTGRILEADLVALADSITEGEVRVVRDARRENRLPAVLVEDLTHAEAGWSGVPTVIERAVRVKYLIRSRSRTGQDHDNGQAQSERSPNHRSLQPAGTMGVPACRSK